MNIIINYEKAKEIRDAANELSINLLRDGVDSLLDQLCQKANTIKVAPNAKVSKDAKVGEEIITGLNQSLSRLCRSLTELQNNWQTLADMSKKGLLRQVISSADFIYGTNRDLAISHKLYGTPSPRGP